MNVNLKFLTGDVDWQTHGGTFISQQLTLPNGTPYYFVVEVLERGQDDYELEALVSAVSPAMYERDLTQSLETYGFTEPFTDHNKVEVMLIEGGTAYIDSVYGSNSLRLMKAAKRLIKNTHAQIDDELNTSANAIGSSKYDFLRGDIFGMSNRIQY